MYRNSKFVLRCILFLCLNISLTSKAAEKNDEKTVAVAPQRVTLADFAGRMTELAKSKQRTQFTITAKVTFVKTVPVPTFKNNDFDIFELSDGPKKVLVGFTHNKVVSPMADVQAKKEATHALVQSLKNSGVYTITVSVLPFDLLSEAQPISLHAVTKAK